LSLDNDEDAQSLFAPMHRYRLYLLKDRDLAYIAGLFDAEVGFIIGKHGSTSDLVLSYLKTNRQILNYLATVFGGSVYLRSRKKSGQRFELWEWRITSRYAYRALKKLYPFLRIKKEAASICLNYYERIRASIREPLSTRKAIAGEYAQLLKPLQKKRRDV